MPPARGKEDHQNGRRILRARNGTRKDRAQVILDDRNGIHIPAAELVIEVAYVYTPILVAIRCAKEMEIPDDYLPHLSPIGWEHIALTGTTTGICSNGRISIGCGRSG